MKDFTLKEAADEAALNFPGIPKEVTRHICEHVMDKILEVIKTGDGRIRLQHADIHTVYYDIKPDQQRAKLADLDESRELTEEEEQLTIIERGNAKGNLPGKVKWLNRRNKRAHSSRFDSSTVYPK